MRPAGLTIFFICQMLLFIGLLPANAEITVDASLSAQSFPVDRAARLTITVSGSRSAEVQMVEVEGLRFHNRGQSSQVSITNGNYSSSISNNFIIEPLRPGTYTIPPISVIAGKTTVRTKAITLEVTPLGQSQSSNKGGTDNETDESEIAFIRCTKISKHYSGEVVPITIKAYFNQKYRANINSLPVLKTDGVVMSPLSNKPDQTQEQLNGKIYSVLRWDTALSGVKTGKHPVLFELDATLNIPQKRQMSPFGGNSLFDDSFFNSFFGGLQQKPIKVISPELHFEVVELPTEDQPENFTGAVGDFHLTTSTSQRQVEIGEPITLTIEIDGKGNFDRVDPPDFPTSPNWKTYTPTSDYSSQGNVISGEKRFEQAIVAKNSTLSQIPSLSFSYFDPEEERYKTITSAPIAVNITGPDAPVVLQQPVQAAAVSQKPQQGSPVEVAPGISGLAPLHLETGSFYSRITPLYKRIWFLTGVGGCTLALLFVLFANIHARNQARHPEILLQRKRRKLLAANLTRLSEAKDSGDGQLFLALCRQSIQQQLGLLWKMEGSAISLADVKNKLMDRPALVEIFEAAEQAAYSTSGLSPETMQIYFEKLEKELEELI